MAYLDDFRLWVHVLVDDMCKELEGHPRRIGLLCVVILPLLLAPQASAATRANEFSSSAAASVPRQPATADQQAPLLNAVQVAAGGQHTCALISSSKAAASLSVVSSDQETAGYAVKCWGANWFGQLGDGTQMDRSIPVDVVGLSGGVQAIAAGEGHTCALTSSGGVKCWGWNTYGQLGDGTRTDRGVGLSVPVDAIGLSRGVYAIAAGARHTCALVRSGNGSVAQSTTTDKPGTEGFAVKCWGENAHGQLGDGTQTVRTTPVDVTGLSSGVYAIAAGGRHTCALIGSGKGSAAQSETTDEAGTGGFAVKCWGDNVHGQLGDGAQPEWRARRLIPVDALGLSSGVYAIAAGARHTCAMISNDKGSASQSTTTDEAGTEGFAVKCWGDNAQGQLGDGATTSRSAPADVKGLSSGVRAIAAGDVHTCALISSSKGATSLSPTADNAGAGDFAAQCWGANNRGQLGDGTKTEWRARRLIPVDVVGLHSGVHAIAGGGWHTCALVGSGGVKCWGDNQFGQLGEGSTDRTTPVDVVGLSSDVYAISAGGRRTCVLTTAGGVQCWGVNRAGQLGDGTQRERRRPVNVVGLSSGVQAIAVSGGGDHEWHTCALTGAGGVKCWGDNDHGQLGDGTQTDRRVPVDVVGLSSGVQAIAAGGMHTCALTTRGDVKCWGLNNRGQLGDGTRPDRRVPVDVKRLSSGVQAIAAGGRHTCALTSAGGVKCWGDNGLGQVGDGSQLVPFLTNRRRPVDVKGLSSGVQAIAAGRRHTCALTTRGGVKCWGSNGSGALGAPTRTPYQSTWVDVVGLSSGVQAIAASNYHTCALTNAGGVKCWGSNTHGQLGDGTTTVGSTANVIPVDVVGLDSGAYAIAAGALHTCAITSSAEGPARQLSVSAEPFAGGVKCWGANRSNQIGDGMGGVTRSAPVDVIMPSQTP